MKLLWHMPTLRATTCGLSLRARRLAHELRTRGHQTTFAVVRDKTDLSGTEIDEFPLCLIDVDRRAPMHWSLQALAKKRDAAAAIAALDDIAHDVFLTCQPEAVTAYRAVRNRRRFNRAAPAPAPKFAESLARQTPTIFVCGGTTLLHDAADAGRGERAGGAAHRIAPAIDRRLKRRAERRAFRTADLCIFDSDATRRRVVETYGIDARKCHALHGAVDCDRFAPPNPAARRAARLSLGIEDDEFIVAWTGRLSPEKNLPTLIRAAHQCATDRIQFVLAGDGPERGALEALNRELNGRARSSNPSRGARSRERVRLLGALADVRALLHAADAFVFPSRSESLGLALVEALSCGLPCVGLAADERAIRNANTEILQTGHCGWLVERNDPAAFAAALDRLAKDADLRATFADRARRRAVERYDWRPAGAAFDSLISSLVCRSNNLSIVPRAVCPPAPAGA